MTETQPSLIDRSLASQLVQTIFSESHGAFGDHLGAGGLYYALATMLRSQVSVCIGSGGGFVPRLMRQAQIDVRIANAHTYLVDANLPDLGFGHPQMAGGWLTEANDLEHESAELTVLRMLSADAAKLFAASGITIDYLHIDGDHSKRGVLADVADYLPLLSPRAVVSLHDLRMEGVRGAMAEIARRYPTLEWVTFGEIGNGSAVLRQRRDALPPLLPQALGEPAETARTTRLDATLAARQAAQSQQKARYERWHYLTSAAYKTRYDVIARSVDLPDQTVVELGGYPNSIIGHLGTAKRLIAIEPYAPAEYLAPIEDIAGAREIAFSMLKGTLATRKLDSAAFGRYALVALGLDVSAGSDSTGDFTTALGNLVDLVAAAAIVAMEAPGYVPSQIALAAVFACIRPAIRHDIRLDLSNDPVAEEYFVKDERARRRILVFEPGGAPDANLRQAVLARAGRQFQDFQAGLPVDVDSSSLVSPGSRKYAFGETVLFKAGSSAGQFLVSGWGQLETQLIWMIGRCSRLRLELTDLPKNAASVVLRLNLRPFLAAGAIGGQGLSILVNGRRVFKGKLKSLGFIDVPMSRELVRARDPVEIVFIHPHGRAPATVPALANGDKRILSFGLESLAFVTTAIIG